MPTPCRSHGHAAFEITSQMLHRVWDVPHTVSHDCAKSWGSSAVAYLKWWTGLTLHSILPVCRSILSCMRVSGLQIICAGVSYTQQDKV